MNVDDFLKQLVVISIFCSLLATPKAESSTPDKELLDLVVEANRANQLLLQSFDCKYYTSSSTVDINKHTVSVISKKGRYAFKGRKVYSKEVIDSDSNEYLHYVHNGAQRRIAFGSSPRTIAMESASSDKSNLKPGTADPWTVAGKTVIEELASASTKMLSADEVLLNGEKCIKIDIIRYLPLPDGTSSPFPMSVWFNTNNGYTLKKYEYAWEGKPGVKGWDGKLVGNGEVKKVLQFDCYGSPVYVPVEFYSYDLGPDGSSRTMEYKIEPDSIRINPDIPDALFVIEIRPDDQVVNLDLGLELQGPGGRNMLADPIIEAQLDVMVTPSAKMPTTKKFEICIDITLDLVYIPAGEFIMGSPDDEIGYPKNILKILKRKKSNKPTRDPAEGPPHIEKVTNGFYMSQCEITCEQFRCFRPRFRKMPYNGLKMDNDKYPACVTWNDAVAFCDWLSQKTGMRARLPKETEWEYACRAGSNSRFFWGNEEEKAGVYANIADISYNKKWPDSIFCLDTDDGNAFMTKVGLYYPNKFGLYDMIGNLSEWCSDNYYADAYKQNFVKPANSNSNVEKVFRGGWFSSDILQIRCSSRGHALPNDSNLFVGFRVLLEI